MTNIIEQLAEVAKDPEAYLNSVHMPEDVPQELAPDILDILNRIPKGWGRWISLDAGWYSLIVDLNRLLNRIEPNYELHQVKEKFGTLRYYIGLSELPKHQCCQDYAEVYPTPERHQWKTDDPNAEAWESNWKIYHEAWTTHHNTKKHKQAEAEREPINKDRRDVFDILQAVVDSFEQKSARTCELCGGRGQMCKSGGHWYKTLCSTCAEASGYVEVEQ